MDNCKNACEFLSTGNNKVDIILAQLQEEIKELCKTSTAKFLMYDEKVVELCVYIKENLSNSLRCLFDDMKSTGELDKVITDAVLNEIKLIEFNLDELNKKTTGIVTPQMFGAHGDGICDDTEAFKKAIEESAGKELYIPKTDGVYKISAITISNIPKIKIDGVIDAEEYVEIKGDINSTERPDINIYKVIGKIKMSGINTGKIKIGKCDTLELISNDRSEFIGYSLFEIGDVINLKISTGGTGWINENIFIGGRLTNVNMNGEKSPEDNLFIKPMFENATIDIIKGYRNRFVNCRFEGKNRLNLGELTYGNYFEKTFFTVPIMMYAKYQYYDIEFNDKGDNFLVRNTGTTSYPLISINQYNNPYNLPVDDFGRIVPSSKWQRLFISDLVELPDSNICLEFINPNKNVDFRLSFYDSTKNLLNTTDSISASQLVANGKGDYSLSSAEVGKVMALIYPNKSAKYVKITILGFGVQMVIDEIEVRVSAKNDKLIQKFIDGFKKPIQE